MRHSFYCIIILFALLGIASCDDGDSVDVSSINKQTVLVYMPWSGSTTDNGLYYSLMQNLDSIESAIRSVRGIPGRLLVFLSTSPTESSLYEVTYNKGSIEHTTLKTYTGNSYTTADGITEILNDVQTNAYALNYAMIIGGHGCGWTYKDDWTSYPYNAKQNLMTGEPSDAKAMSGVSARQTTMTVDPRTRFYGSVSSTNYATDIPTLASGISAAGIKMQYILFDDCYMANIETAYELKDVTNFLIGSTSEVLAFGMPYHTMWRYLASSTPAYATIISAFHTFYSSYAIPYGSLSAIDCREVEALAVLMKEINSRYTFDTSLLDSIQVLDGFTVPLFYDMGSYVDHLCENTTLRSNFHSQLDNVIKAAATTDSVYSYLYGTAQYIKIDTFSGITISDPSINSVSIKGREKTKWWQNTH